MKDKLERLIRDIPDFPQKGITFKDITPLLADGEALVQAVEYMASPYKDQGIAKIVGIEARGFILGAPIAAALGCGFVPVRKPGKLPYATLRRDYDLEYGTDAVEMHTDAVARGERVVVVDDVLATGGTMLATCQLLGEVGARIQGLCFLMELAFLNGREKLTQWPISTVLTYS